MTWVPEMAARSKAMRDRWIPPVEYRPERSWGGRAVGRGGLAAVHVGVQGQGQVHRRVDGDRIVQGRVGVVRGELRTGPSGPSTRAVGTGCCATGSPVAGSVAEPHIWAGSAPPTTVPEASVRTRDPSGPSDADRPSRARGTSRVVGASAGESTVKLASNPWALA